MHFKKHVCLFFFILSKNQTQNNHQVYYTHFIHICIQYLVAIKIRQCESVFSRWTVRLSLSVFVCVMMLFFDSWHLHCLTVQCTQTQYAYETMRRCGYRLIITNLFSLYVYTDVYYHLHWNVLSGLAKLSPKLEFNLFGNRCGTFGGDATSLITHTQIVFHECGLHFYSIVGDAKKKN